MKTITKDLLKAEIFDTREEMGCKAAADIADKINELLKEKEYINMIFAAAPSQQDMLACLIKKDIDWSRINAFHMDEYIGLAKDAPQGFGNFLARHIFDKVPFRSVNYINGQNEDYNAECARYSELLKKYPTDIVCLGIGENGHIAFNDPDMADFDDKFMVKPVELDDICRQQQVNDGCFADISEVPKVAITLTVPTLFAGGYLFCVVPAATKANAVKEVMTTDKIDEHCPATIMRKHKNATMYCDIDSGKYLL